VNDSPLKKIFLNLWPLIAIFFLWNTPVVYPLKVLVVFFHESSHAIITILTGGEVKEMVINKNQGGHVLSIGGWRFLILSAGYLGSLVWGTTIFLISMNSSKDRLINRILAIIILTVTILFVRNIFGFIFNGAIFFTLVFISYKMNNKVNDLVLRTIGLTSMIYAPLDIYSDTIARSHLRSDAYMIANETFNGVWILGSTWFWGLLWIVISLFVLLFVLLKITVKRKTQTFV